MLSSSECHVKPRITPVIFLTSVVFSKLNVPSLPHLFILNVVLDPLTLLSVPRKQNCVGETEHNKYIFSLASHIAALYGLHFHRNCVYVCLCVLNHV